MALPTIEDVRAAAARLAGVAVRTPLLRHPALDAAAGGPVLVKAEAWQRMGAFKLRGAYNRLVQLAPADRARGVVAFSSGNHAQGVALAARLLAIPAVVVMPADAPAAKIAATRALGAEVRLYDRLRESREAIAAALAAERGVVVVPAFDDPHVIAGQGTVGLEALEQVAALGLGIAAIAAPASGGGLLAGVALAAQAADPSIALLSVEPEGHDDLARALAAGRTQDNAPGVRSVCDALLAPAPGALTLPILLAAGARGLAVGDAQAFAAMAFAYRAWGLVLEPGGAVALAAALGGRLPAPRDREGGVLVVIASGGNVDAAMFARALLAPAPSWPRSSARSSARSSV